MTRSILWAYRPLAWVFVLGMDSIEIASQKYIPIGYSVSIQKSDCQHCAERRLDFAMTQGVASAEAMFLCDAPSLVTNIWLPRFASDCVNRIKFIVTFFKVEDCVCWFRCGCNKTTETPTFFLILRDLHN
jgi:hypothetical protein